MAKSRRRKMARRATPTSDVVVVDPVDGTTEYVKSPTMAAQLTAEPVPVIDTKATPAEMKDILCATCGKSAPLLAATGECAACTNVKGSMRESIGGPRGRRFAK